MNEKYPILFPGRGISFDRVYLCRRSEATLHNNGPGNTARATSFRPISSVFTEQRTGILWVSPSLHEMSCNVGSDASAMCVRTSCYDVGCNGSVMPGVSI